MYLDFSYYLLFLISFISLSEAISSQIIGSDFKDSQILAVLLLHRSVGLNITSIIIATKAVTFENIIYGFYAVFKSIFLFIF